MKEKGYYLDGETIVINRDLNKLDLFLKDFLDVLKKYSDYLVVSGFVSSMLCISIFSYHTPNV